MKALFASHRGYLGIIMAPVLQVAGHEVIGLGTGWFIGCVFNPAPTDPPGLRIDLRDMTAVDLEGFDAVIHLAALSSDPLGHLIPEITYDINHAASVQLVRLAKQAGVGRFPYFSACSIYGVTSDGLVMEDADLALAVPCTINKMRVKKDLDELTDTDFCTVSLRNATTSGFSPRLCADIMLNNLVGYALLTGQMLVPSDGTPRRPLVHAIDIARMFTTVLIAPAGEVRSKKINVGTKADSVIVAEIAEVIAVRTGAAVRIISEVGNDLHSYRADFSWLRRLLLGANVRRSIADGVQELVVAYHDHSTTGDPFTRRFVRLTRTHELWESFRISTGFRVMPRGREQRGRIMAERILCGSGTGVIVPDLGAQPSPRHWLLPTNPLLDPTHSLALRLCPDCGLAQFDAGGATESEVPVPEPQAIVDQVRRAVTDLGRLGHFDGRIPVVEFGSPRNGSWLPLLDLTSTDGLADLVVDSFGSMYGHDLPAALARRIKTLADDGLAAFLIQPLGDIIAQSVWTVLHHNHHGYFTLVSLRTALDTARITPAGVLCYDLCGGVAAALINRDGQPDADLLIAHGDESRQGLAILEGLACLAEAVSVSAGRLRNHLEGHRAVGVRLFAYDATSKAVAELAMMGGTAGAILMAGDALLAKQGRCMPASRIPVISPAELVVADPAEVLLLPLDLHDELLATHLSLAGRVVVSGADPAGTPRPIPSGGAATCPNTPGRNMGGR